MPLDDAQPLRDIDIGVGEGHRESAAVDVKRVGDRAAYSPCPPISETEGIRIDYKVRMAGRTLAGETVKQPATVGGPNGKSPIVTARHFDERIADRVLSLERLRDFPECR